MAQHKKFGSSTARKTINCAAWTNIVSPELPEKDSPAAARGTMLHQIMEDMYSLDSFDIPDLSDEDRVAINIATEATEAVLDTYDIEEFLLEQFMAHPDREDTGGTADMLGWTDEVAVNLDYKFGRVPVDYWDQHLFGFLMWRLNTENAKYMLGKRLVAVIIQPAVSSKPIIKEFSQSDLDQYEIDFMKALERADTGTTIGFPGDWCKYCPKAPYCDAKKNQVGDFLSYDPKNMLELADGMALLAQIKDHVKAVEAETFRQLEAGRPVPGWKLVLKRGVNHWGNATDALARLRKQRTLPKELYLEEKLRTAPQVLTAAKKAKLDYKPLAAMITNESSGTTIAPASDKREAVVLPGQMVPEALDKILGGG